MSEETMESQAVDNVDEVGTQPGTTDIKVGEQTTEPIDEKETKDEPKVEPDKEKPKEGMFPDDWREKLAKGDEKKLKMLQRYSSPDAMAESFFEKDKKIRSGELKSVWNPEASPEEQKQWRKENGIPESADKYEVKVPEGMALGQLDSEIVEEYKNVAFGENLTPGQFEKQVSWFLDTQQKMLAKVNDMVAESDAKAKAEAEDQLREMFGGDYKPNMNALSNFMEGMKPELKEAFQNARLGNGKPILSDAGMVAHLVQMQRELNPATLVPGGNAYNESTVVSRMKEIKNEIMGTEKYTPEIQAEYRALLEAEEKYKTRR